MPRRGGMSSLLSSFGSVGVRFFGRSAGPGWRGAVEVVRASRVVDAAGAPGFVGAWDAVGFRGPGLGAAEGAVPVRGVVPGCGAVGGGGGGGGRGRGGSRSGEGTPRASRRRATHWLRTQPTRRRPPTPSVGSTQPCPLSSFVHVTRSTRRPGWTHHLG